MNQQFEKLNELSLKAGGLNGLLHFVFDHIEESGGEIRLSHKITSSAFYQLITISEEIKEMIDEHHVEFVKLTKISD